MRRASASFAACMLARPAVSTMTAGGRCGRLPQSLGVRQGLVEGPTVFTVMYDETLQAVQADRNDEWLAVFCDPALCTSRIEASMEMQAALGETVFMDDLSQMLVARDEAAVEEMRGHRRGSRLTASQ